MLLTAKRPRRKLSEALAQNDDLRRNQAADRDRKGRHKKDAERTLCFEVAPDANKTQIRQAVEKLFKVKVEEVRTATIDGKLRRRGTFLRLSLGLEKSLREAEAGPENAGVRGDLEHAD